MPESSFRQLLRRPGALPEQTKNVQNDSGSINSIRPVFGILLAKELLPSLNRSQWCIRWQDSGSITWQLPQRR